MGQLEALRIFVVDDEEMIVVTLSAILRHFGFDVSPFTNPLEALEAAESFRPQLLITDVSMPGLSGIDLAILIRDKLPECRILLFSGQGKTSDQQVNARKRGYEFELLTKPVHPTVLLAVVNSHHYDSSGSRQASS